MKGKVWPGECNFPDYTNPEVREWWAGLFKELISDIGVKGVWNDMNEPAVMEVPNKHSLWTFVMIMTEIHAVIERHIIFMVRRWQELLITV
jgi:alpha-glucosidase (family GH31 glycosyl hydrolase)